jgi:hypothetical protein
VTILRNDQIALKWLHHFDAQTRPKLQTPRQKRLLFDGHGSHLTYEFISFCHENQIIPFYFLPKSTHYIQPLDGSAFQTYKQHYKCNNNRITQWGGSTSDKVDFLPNSRCSPKTLPINILPVRIRSPNSICPYPPHIIRDQLEAERTLTIKSKKFAASDNSYA